ncbi:YEATS-associated helix-containing protein [Labrenzia sp. PHM005]|uniref:YEATS-associated helix-containing protein n=1 Tax=Labrenzia sp. PHM005 TaxID=2590016 RepID=UPI0011405314|nr:YEATS-associated helix-containing protein [Labrenzia sp. PHM005]QDG75637.1 hypothetical protein FJ695_07060 [Labrenzia sp. PHM005]
MTEFLEFLKAILPLSLTMIIAGGFGGLAAFLTTAQPAASQVRLGAFGFCLVGMIAALTVPLFLSLLQSKLLDDVKSSQDSEAYLIFAGFYILAGFTAKAFLSTLSDKVIHELTNKMTDGEERAQIQIQELKDNLAYSLHSKDHMETTAEQPLPPKLGQIGRSLTDLEKAVLQAAANFTVRTIDGIAQDCGLHSNQAATIISKLVERGLATHVKPPGFGRRLVSLTEDGLELAARLAIGAAL